MMVLLLKGNCLPRIERSHQINLSSKLRPSANFAPRFVAGKLKAKGHGGVGLGCPCTDNHTQLTDVQCNFMHIYSEVRPTVFNAASSQVNVFSIEDLWPNPIS